MDIKNVRNYNFILNGCNKSMGIKRKRIPLSEIIYKNDKKYAMDGGKCRMVCECMVFYRNCMKCNLKLAKRHSDYILLMVKHCKEASESRKRTRPHEDHDFCLKTFLKIIYTIIKENKLICMCDLCMNLENKQKLSIRGPNKLSVDRVFDNIGYTHKDQKLRLISKSHHSWQKRDSIPIASKKRKWIQRAKDGILQRSIKRYNRIEDEIISMGNSGLDIKELKHQQKTHVITPEYCEYMLNNKKENTPNCKKCNVKLDYGDENGNVFTRGESKRASPDRINNRIGYISDNVRMVCFSCQTIESIDDREDLFLDDKEYIELLEYIEKKIIKIIC